MIIEVWTVSHNTHPSGQIETIVFPNEQAAAALPLKFNSIRTRTPEGEYQ